MNELEFLSQVIDAKADRIKTLAREIWGYAELAYEEEKSAAALQQALASEGFTIEKGIADIPTAFTATAERSAVAQNMHLTNLSFILILLNWLCEQSGEFSAYEGVAVARQLRRDAFKESLDLGAEARFETPPHRDG